MIVLIVITVFFQLTMSSGCTFFLFHSYLRSADDVEQTNL